MSANGDPIQLVTNQDGTISKSSFTNYVKVFQGDEYLKNRISFNAFDGRITFSGFYWDARPHPVRDADFTNIRFFLDRIYTLNNKDNIKDAIIKVANDHIFHPVVNCLKSLKWDGVERIRDLLPKYLGAERSEYTTAVTRLLLYGAIRRVTDPGCKFDYCVIFADTIQGTGKSSLCRFLALNDEWYTDSLNNLNDSDKAFELIRGKWIIELGELLAVRKAQDVETIKAFISRQCQDYRNKYGVFAENYPRQCIFIGTTNKPYFLPEDKTGNRRFIPVRCDGRKAEVHPLDNEAETREFIRQCYAEALETGRAENYPLVLDQKFSEMLETIQKEATPDDTRIGLIQAWLDDLPEGVEFVCARMIWNHVFAGTYERPPQAYELRDIADIMNLSISGWTKYRSITGYDKKNFNNKYGVQRAWKRTQNVAGRIADCRTKRPLSLPKDRIPHDDDDF